MLKGFILTILVVAYICVGKPGHTQQFLHISDQEKVELAVDMLRKGVQQEDTTKIGMILASAILKAGKETAKEDFKDTIQAIFARASNRHIVLSSPDAIEKDSPYGDSDFWDFDILNPVISFKVDSAIVDCELVLWGDKINGGRRIKERLVLIVPGDDGRSKMPNGYSQWPKTPNEKNEMTNNRVWGLAGFENLLDFLSSACVFQEAEANKAGKKEQ